jgi:hypothetical protein
MPAPDRDVDGSPATQEVPLGRRCTPGAPTRGSTTIPARAPRSPGHNSTARTIALRTEWSAAPVAPSPPRSTATVNVGSMTAGSPVPRAPQSQEIPARRRTRSAQAPADWGGVVQQGRPRPNHSATSSVAAFSRSSCLITRKIVFDRSFWEFFFVFYLLFVARVWSKEVPAMSQ